jgi:cephalosporin hydroxylase
VVGVDIDIRAHNRSAIDAHELKPLITLVEGSSVDPATIATVRKLIAPGERVLVLLDSDHSKQHVGLELDAYAPLVTPGSYIVATDGLMEFLEDVPRGKPGWSLDNPKAAAEAFLETHPEFVLEEPPPISFNEGEIRERITHWPGAYLRRRG